MGGIRIPTVTPLAEGEQTQHWRGSTGKRGTGKRANAGQHAAAAVVDELIAKIQRHMQTSHSRQIDVFHEIDSDGSGTLTAVELHRALAQMDGDSPTRTEVDALLRAVDANDNGTVSIEEFFNYFKHAKRGHVAPGNGNGGPVRVATTPMLSRGGGGKKAAEKEAEQLERKLRTANDENYLLQMQLGKLQSTLKKAQTKLETVQTWRDATGGAEASSSASPRSPYEPLFEKQVASLKTQLAATEQKLKTAQQSQLQLRAVQTWQGVVEPEAPQSEPEARDTTPGRRRSPRRLPWKPRSEQQPSSVLPAAPGECGSPASSSAQAVAAAEEAAADMAAALAAKDLEVAGFQEKTREREREAAGIMKAQACETERLRSESALLKTALHELESSSASLLEEKSELELRYSRGDGAAQRQIAELQATLLEAVSEQSVTTEQLSVLRAESSGWQKEKATMEISLREAAGAWEALSQQETELKDYTVLKRERDDVQAKLAMALSVTKDAEARAGKAEKALDSTKKKRGKLANGAAKQYVHTQSSPQLDFQGIFLRGCS